VITREAAAKLTVGEVMLTRPKTLPTEASVADVRRLFENESVRTALLVDGPMYAGTVEREDVPGGASDSEPVRPFARIDAEDLIGPHALVRDVLERLDGTREGRLVVVGEDGTTLLGLLCRRSVDDAFCSGGEGD
jgi:hypothetical protein